MGDLLQLERHTLAHLSRTGRERLFAELSGKGYAPGALGEMLLPERHPDAKGALPVPGIVRREEFRPRQGFVPVGFSFWKNDENGRLRVPGFALPEEIESIASPETVAAKIEGWDRRRVSRTPALAALKALREAWNPFAEKPGVWGSAALELETGRPYTHQWSDLDVRLAPVVPAGREDWERRQNILLAVEKKFAIRVDAELLLPDGYGISVKELLQKGMTVLAKGRRDVVLLQKADVFAALAGQPAGCHVSNH